MRRKSRLLKSAMGMMSIIVLQLLLYWTLPSVVSVLRYERGSIEEAQILSETQGIRQVYLYQHRIFGVYETSEGRFYYVTGPEDAARLEHMQSSYAPALAGGREAKNNAMMDGYTMTAILFALTILMISRSDAYPIATAPQPARPVRAKESISTGKAVREDGVGKNGDAGYGFIHRENTKNGRVVSFDDVAGYERTKESLRFISQCVSQHDLLCAAGAHLPHGILLYGPPGTGKTLMAAAIAGTAGVPFYSVNASSFVNIYVGTGPAAVRELYAKARKNAPAIVFIDEVDAIGRRRDGTANSEYLNTTNAILGELDGIDSAMGVLTIAATNALEQLDPAFTRAGRFDRKIEVPLPNEIDRLAILRCHCKGKRLLDKTILARIAIQTEGMSPAELETLMNESAIRAASSGRTTITEQDIESALFEIVSGGMELNADAAVAGAVAWHEAGHAICMKLLSGMSVGHVTIRETTNGFAGATLHVDRCSGLATRASMENAIKCLYAGRAAEELFAGNSQDITVAASGDIAEASRLIRDYVLCFGVGEQTPLNLSTFSGGAASSKLVDESLQLANKLYAETKCFLKENEHLVRVVADALIREETLQESQLDELLTKN